MESSYVDVSLPPPPPQSLNVRTRAGGESGAVYLGAVGGQNRIPLSFCHSRPKRKIREEREITQRS